ncbi:MAG: protein kinase [Planctomycetota bacterium]
MESLTPTCDVAGRYRLAGRLGAGGFGEVWRAEDLLAGEQVALKRLGHVPEDQRVLVRREVAALRMLRVPGVAPLLDQGTDGEGAFLVMELASGADFPGSLALSDWRDVVARAVAVLEILERVHAAGVLHRDLKPANVLVDDDGQVTIVDFGISAGASIDPGMGGLHAGIGTPAYAAPEQLLGQPPDARSDLYSVGVMLFEALAGRPPHGGASVEELISSRLADPAPPLSAYREVPAFVARAVAALLAQRAADRPRSASDALGLLHGAAELRTDSELPWLGDRTAIDRALAALDAGDPVCVAGPAGSGRTRVLYELARVLGERGRRAEVLPPGEEPFESLTPLYEDFEEEAETLEQARAVARDGVDRVLAAGAVLLAGSATDIDPETRALLDERGAAPGVVRVVDAEEPPPGLGPWSEAELRELFAGPDRVLHLREDAALQLHLRTGGRRDAVAQEVERWVRAGLATWSGRTLALTRRALEWLEDDAGRGAAGESSKAERTRLSGLLAAGAPEELARATLEAAFRRVGSGRLGEATSILRWGLAALRDEPSPAALELAREMCYVAHYEGSAQACDRVLYELSRLGRTAEVSQLERLMQAAVAALEADGARALALAEALPDYREPNLQVLRWAVLIRAARLSDSDGFADVLHRAEAFVEAGGSRDVLAGVAEGRGLLAYRRGDFAAAAEAHGRAAELFQLVPSRLSAELNRASALLDDLRPAEARRVAEAALVRARDVRLPLFEARAEWLARAARYRDGGGGAPDHELFAAVQHLGNLDLLALVGLYEGAFAWRAGQHDEARDLIAHTTRTWRRLGRRWPALLARALELAARAEPEPGEPAALGREAADCPLPRLKAQTLALLRHAGHPQAAEAEAAAAVRASVPRPRHGVRFEVLCTDELA